MNEQLKTQPKCTLYLDRPEDLLADTEQGLTDQLAHFVISVAISEGTDTGHTEIVFLDDEPTESLAESLPIEIVTGVHRLLARELTR